MIRRTDDAVDFDVSYNTYKSAFGVQSVGSYWMGLDAMHGSTSPCPASVRMEHLDSSGTQHFTYFRKFFVSSSSAGYRARYIGKETDIPDGETTHCNSFHTSMNRFSARDHWIHDESDNRAATSHGGWWWASGGGNALTRPFSSL